MARKKMTQSRRRTSTKLSLRGLAETAIIGSAATKMLFGVNLGSFLSGITSGSNSGTGFYPNQDGASMITLPELLGFTATGWNPSAVGGTYGNSSFTESVMGNVRAHAPMAIGTAILTPFLFRIGFKAFRKPVSFINRNLLKGTGVRI